MDLERVREELKNRKFKIDEELTEQIDDDCYVEVYEKRDNLVEVLYSSLKVIEIFISNSEYDFKTDENEREGINLRIKDEKYGLTEENLLYCLKIQENPEDHVINFCKFYSEFMKWKTKELSPVLKHFELGEVAGNTIGEDYFPLSTWFSYEGNDLYFTLIINPLTFKVDIEFGIIGERSNDVLGQLFGEPSDIIFSALDDIQNEFQCRH
jgi:hypothetical protein